VVKKQLILTIELQEKSPSIYKNKNDNNLLHCLLVVRGRGDKCPHLNLATPLGNGI
jgi:hypothetical protein